MRFFILTFLAFILVFPAYAEEETKTIDDIVEEVIEEKEPEADPSSRYAPDHCDFEVTFPEEPYTAKRCPQGAKKCYDMTSYSMVYNAGTTVDFNITCVPSKPENYGRYNDRVLKSALLGMVQRSQVDDYEVNTEEQEDMRYGSLIGEARSGNQERIYNAQIWVGQNSVMTIEAKLIGRKHHEADAVFADVLKSVKRKEAEKAVKEKPEEKSEEKED